MEFVLPKWFYRGVIDRSLVLTIDPAYFRLTGGIERCSMHRAQARRPPTRRVVVRTAANRRRSRRSAPGCRFERALLLQRMHGTARHGFHAQAAERHHPLRRQHRRRQLR
jgi:plasmid replication initiation protein